MASLGTRNAELIWSLTMDRQLSELQIKKELGLGTATVNRIVRMLVAHGLMTRTPPVGNAAGAVYSSKGSLQELRSKFAPRAAHVEDRAGFGEGIPRVPSVWALGAVMGLA